MNLGTSLHWVSRKMKNKPSIIEDGNEITYSELWHNIEQLAKGFLKIGIVQDDKLVLFLPNCKEFIYSFYALSRINAISTPLDIRLSPFEIKRIFEDLSPKGIITNSFLYEKKISLVVQKDETLILVDDDKTRYKGKVYYFEELLDIGKDSILPRFSTNNNQPASINYTYRGLGKPIGAVLTHGNYHHGAIGYIRLTQVSSHQRMLLVTPMSHIFSLVGCVIVGLLRGGTVIIAKSFIPSHIFKIIEKYKVDFIIATPTIYISLLSNYDKNKYDISSLRYGITGGSSLPPGLYKEVKRRLGIELLQGYGLTETMPIICNPRFKNKPESIGIPGHEVKVRIVNERGLDAKIGEKGEILIGGPTVMKGYYNKNGENKKFFRDGWFFTGDYGWMDEEGYIYFEGLKKEIIKVGGNNVDLNEVKEVLKMYPGVKSVELDIVWDYMWENLLNARVKIKRGRQISEKDIKSFCKQHLADYKVPNRIFVIR